MVGLVEYGLKPGLKRKARMVVSESHVASFIGSGSLRVLSTPSMVGLMEKASRLLADEYLPEGYTTVGVKVEVSHVNPAPIGAKVVAIAELEDVDGRRLRFKVKAYWKEKLIGKGYHERVIVDIERFLKKVEAMIKS